MSLAPRPYTLVAELTYRCPLRCLYCSNPVDFAHLRDELSTAQWCRAFSEATELGVVQLHLSGGEPMLREDLGDLIRHARACDLYIESNHRRHAASMKKNFAASVMTGLDHIQLSIQGAWGLNVAEMVAGSPIASQET